MSTLLFYSAPAALNRDQHKALRFTASSDFGFSAKVNSVPMTGIEFFEASRDMPVLFSCDEQGNYFPLALLSLMDDGHSFLKEEGKWDDCYVPAFIRRYPFALTDDGTVCIDKAAKQFSEEEGELLFKEDGENSDILNNAINFLNHFDQQHKATVAFCAEAKEADLFKPFNIQVMLEKDNPLRLQGLFSIDEAKLNELPEEKVNAWFKSGWLAWSYAHLHSLGALNRLIKRQKQQIAEAAE